MCDPLSMSLQACYPPEYLQECQSKFFDETEIQTASFLPPLPKILFEGPECKKLRESVNFWRKTFKNFLIGIPVTASAFTIAKSSHEIKNDQEVSLGSIALYFFGAIGISGPVLWLPALSLKEAERNYFNRCGPPPPPSKKIPKKVPEPDPIGMPLPEPSFFDELSDAVDNVRGQDLLNAAEVVAKGLITGALIVIMAVPSLIFAS